MPIHFSIGRSKMPDAMKKNIMWDATPIGRQKVQNYEGVESPRFRTLAVIVEEGPCSLEEVAEKAHLNQKTTNMHLQDLSKMQLVRQVSHKTVAE